MRWKPTLAGLAVPAADAWVHFNAGLPCPDGSKVNHRWKPAQLREHAATFFIFIQRLQAKYRKGTWFAGNVACPEFAEAIKALFPQATFVMLNHAPFSAETRKRAYFATHQFDLTALECLTGSCTVAEFFDIDQDRVVHAPCAAARQVASGTASGTQKSGMHRH